VLALKDFQYAGKTRRKDTEYEVEPGHLALLERIGVARKQEVRSRRVYRRRDMTPETTERAVVEAAPEEPTPEEIVAETPEPTDDAD
jgi:hypothetical protein